MIPFSQKTDDELLLSIKVARQHGFHTVCLMEIDESVVVETNTSGDYFADMTEQATSHVMIAGSITNDTEVLAVITEYRSEKATA